MVQGGNGAVPRKERGMKSEDDELKGESRALRARLSWSGEANLRHSRRKPATRNPGIRRPQFIRQTVRGAMKKGTPYGVPLAADISLERLSG